MCEAVLQLFFQSPDDLGLGGGPTRLLQDAQDREHIDPIRRVSRRRKRTEPRSARQPVARLRQQGELLVAVGDQLDPAPRSLDGRGIVMENLRLFLVPGEFEHTIQGLAHQIE